MRGKKTSLDRGFKAMLAEPHNDQLNELKIEALYMCRFMRDTLKMKLVDIAEAHKMERTTFSSRMKENEILERTLIESGKLNDEKIQQIKKKVFVDFLIEFGIMDLNQSTEEMMLYKTVLEKINSGKLKITDNNDEKTRLPVLQV